MELLACVCSHLTTQPGVSILQHVTRPPASPRDIEQWEKEHSPYTLPADLKSLYSFNDGILVRWQVKYGNEQFPIGSIHVPAISQIKRVSLGVTVHFAPRLPYTQLFSAQQQHTPSTSAAAAALMSSSSAPTTAPPSFLRSFLSTSSVTTSTNDSEPFPGTRLGAESNVDDGDEEDASLIKQPLAPTSAGAAAALNRVCAFDIDPMCTDGRVLLVYFPNDSNPAVYFQDLSCRLYFLASSFSEYYALLLVHLGISHWQYAFTQIGMSATTKNWMRMFAPERLFLDMQYSNLLRAFLQSFSALNQNTSLLTQSAAAESNPPPSKFPLISRSIEPKGPAALAMVSMMVRGAQVTASVYSSTGSPVETKRRIPTAHLQSSSSTSHPTLSHTSSAAQLGTSGVSASPVAPRPNTVAGWRAPAPPERPSLQRSASALGSPPARAAPNAPLGSPAPASTPLPPRPQGSLNLSEIDALVASKMVPAVVEKKPAPAPPPTAPPPAESVGTTTPVAAAPAPSNSHVSTSATSATAAVRGPSPPTPSTAAPPTSAPVMSQRLHAFRASSLGTPASMNQPQAPASQPVAPAMPAAVAAAAPLPNNNAWSIAPATVAHSFAHSSTAMATNAALSHGPSSHSTSAHGHSAHGMSAHGPLSSVGTNGAPIATRRLSVADRIGMSAVPPRPSSGSQRRSSLSLAPSYSGTTTTTKGTTAISLGIGVGPTSGALGSARPVSAKH